jgi:hypothetical protein
MFVQGTEGRNAAVYNNTAANFDLSLFLFSDAPELVNHFNVQVRLLCVLLFSKSLFFPAKVHDYLLKAGHGKDDLYLLFNFFVLIPMHCCRRTLSLYFKIFIMRYVDDGVDVDYV